MYPEHHHFGITGQSEASFVWRKWPHVDAGDLVSGTSMNLRSPMEMGLTFRVEGYGLAMHEELIPHIDWFT